MIVYVLFLVWSNFDYGRKGASMPQAREFSIRITNGWPHFVMRARLGDRHGRLVGELTARCMSSPAKVLLGKIIAAKEYREELQALLFNRFEQAMRLGKRNLILTECVREQRTFFESVGFRILANSHGGYQMEKQL